MENKICKICNINKPISEYHKQLKGKFGVKTICKDCRKIEKRTYSQLPHVKQKIKDNYQKNKSEIRERLKVYYWSFVSQYHSYIKTSKKRNIKFSLSKDECRIFYNTNCYYCGNEYEGLGIDRIDSSKGYEIDNVRACCKFCNFMKHTSTEKQFYERIIKICKNLKLNNMGFLQEIQELSANHKSPKLEDVKFRIKKHAADGERKMTLDHSLYDNYVKKWLQAQGFGVTETSDQRDGDFITITW